MAERKTTPKSEYRKQRDAYRSACDRHVVTFESDMTEDEKRHAFAIADDIRQAGNEVVAELNKRVDQLYRRRKYRSLLNAYGQATEKLSKISASLSDVCINQEKSDKLLAEEAGLKSRLAEVSNELNATQKAFGLTKADVTGLMSEQARVRNFNSVFGLTKAEDIWQALEKVLYGNGKRLHFKKRGDLPVIRAKQINRAIVMEYDKDAGLVFYVDGIGEFLVDHRQMDRFLSDEYQRLLTYMENPDVEKDAVLDYAKKQTLCEVFRPCYVCLVCKQIRHRLRVFVQITVAGRPCEKYDRYERPRHVYGKGRVGIDLGTQSVAITSSDITELVNLAERDGKCTKRNEQTKVRLRRKMDASKRATNPERFNEDGTYKKGSDGKWNFSNRYRKCRYRLKEMERRDADSRKYAVRELANHIRSLGDVCIIEKPNASKLQKRSKNTERQDKETVVMAKDGTQKTIYKYKKKKRFGKSILHRCPGAFQAYLKQLFQNNYHEVPSNYRASQYDHMENIYRKKKLSDRWHTFHNGIRIQRDSYSSFLLFCANDSFDCIDREQCDASFNDYRKHHNDMINGIKSAGAHICNSGI